MKYIYTLGGDSLHQVNEQRDFGIVVSRDSAPMSHISEIVKKAYQRITVMKYSFANINPKTVKKKLRKNYTLLSYTLYTFAMCRLRV